MSWCSHDVYWGVLLVWVLGAWAAFVALRRRAAPYGRHHPRPEGGIPSRIAWILMELPSAISFAAVALPRVTGWTWLLVGLWELHYLQRGLVYPLRIRSPRRVPIWVVASAFLFTTMNGLLNAWGLFVVGPELGASGPSDPRLLVGVALFLAGFLVNIEADARLIATPRGPDGAYRVPSGGLFRFVSCPNYLGEIVEWCGWALASGTAAGLSFAIWTVANLVPRAHAHHAWYRLQFADYPRERRALVPRLRVLFHEDAR